MGNRAVITTRENFDNHGIGVYLHWNGDCESVVAFLKYCERHGYRSPKEDSSYGFAMLVNTITNFFGSGLSCGIDVVNKLDCNNGNNGVYIIDGWDIIDREYLPTSVYDLDIDKDELEEFIKEIDSRQPEQLRIFE